MCARFSTVVRTLRPDALLRSRVNFCHLFSPAHIASRPSTHVLPSPFVHTKVKTVKITLDVVPRKLSVDSYAY
jgi:hypothetical protein